MKRKFEKILRSKLLATLMIAVFLIAFVPNTNAASLTSVSDTMSRLKASTASNHTIGFTTPTGVDASSDTIALDFTLFSGTVVASDVSLTHGPTTGLETAETIAATASSGVWGANWSSTTLTLTAPTNAASGEITANDKVIITISNNKITNPTSGTRYITIGGTFGDSGKVAVAILSDDQIPVSASIDPSLTFTVANTTLALSTLSSSSISTSGENNITIGTNGNKGYTIALKDVGNSSNPGLYNSGASKLVASSTATLSAGTEGYGANCNKTSGDGTCSFANGATENVTGLTLAGGTFASLASKPSGTDTFRIRVKAAVSSSTDAGAYTDTLTVIGTANF